MSLRNYPKFAKLLVFCQGFFSGGKVKSKFMQTILSFIVILIFLLFLDQILGGQKDESHIKG